MPEKLIRNEHGDMLKVDQDGFLIDGVLVKIELDDIIIRDLEGFLDLVSEEAGFPVLQQQTVEIEGHEGSLLLLRVKGDVSACMELFDDSTDESS